MVKGKKKMTLNLEPFDYGKAMRRESFERKVADMQEGRRQRAVTFTNRKKEVSRNACRKGNW
jgi:hypothetical protein